MPRIHYNRANADPTLDGLDWKPHPDGGLVSPELPDEVAARYEQFKDFSVLQARGAKGTAPAPVVPPSGTVPAGATPAGAETTAGAAGDDSIDGGTGAPPAPPPSSVPGASLPDIF